MEVSIIELDPNSYLGEAIQYEVDGKLLTFITRYNAYHDFYTVDIICNGEPIVKGHKLTTGIDLLAYFKEGEVIHPQIPPIQVVPILFNNDKEIIGIEDYGSNSGLAIIRSD